MPCRMKGVCAQVAVRITPARLYGLGDRVRGVDRNIELAGHAARERHGALVHQVVHPYLPDGTMRASARSWNVPCDAGAHDRDDIRVTPREHVGCKGTSHAGAHRREIRGVHHGEQRAVLNVMQAEDTSNGRRLPGKLGVHLHGVHGETRKSSREEHGRGTRSLRQSRRR